MNILFDINHPAHVHLFRNAIKELEKRGDRIIIVARDKDVTVRLLDYYGFRYHLLSKASKGLVQLALELLIRQIKLFPILLKNHINLCVSVTGATCVHIARFLKIPCLVFYDTEHAKIQNTLTIPFATQYITPEYHFQRLGKNHITYKGLHELAYLHPNYFQPDPSIYNQLKIRRDENFVIIRFVSWAAAHDVRQSGISLELKRELIHLLLPFAHVFIVSEAPLDKEFEPYRLTLPPEKIHDALNFAIMYIGEGGKMALEAAVLGTPSVFVNSLTAGVLQRLEQDYDLLYNFLPNQTQEILKRIESLLKQPNLKGTWQIKRQKFLGDHIDLTKWMVKKILEFDPNVIGAPRRL